MVSTRKPLPFRRKLTITIPEEILDELPPTDEELIRDIVFLLRFDTENTNEDYYHQPNSNGKRQRHPLCQGRIGSAKRPRKEPMLTSNT